MRFHKTFPALFFTLCLLLPPLASVASAEEHTNAQFEKLLSELSHDKRRMLDDTMKRADKQNRKLREEKRKIEEELDDLLDAPAFDKATYLDKSTKLGRIRAKIHANMDDAFATVAAQLSPEERKLFKKYTLWQTHRDSQDGLHDDEENNHQPAEQ